MLHKNYRCGPLAQRARRAGHWRAVSAGLRFSNGFLPCHTIACLATVGVHSESVRTDAADFGVEVANAHFLGLGSGNCFALLQCGKNTERLGFRIDKFHSITFL